jgi:hypothetical protein
LASASLASAGRCAVEDAGWRLPKIFTEHCSFFCWQYPKQDDWSDRFAAQVLAQDAYSFEQTS